MRLKFLLVVLLTLLSVQTAAAQQNPNVVIFNGFHFTYDSALARNVNIVQFAGDPVNQEGPGGPEPPHIQFILYNTPAPNPDGTPNPIPGPFEAPGVIRFYKAADINRYKLSQMQFTALSKLLANHTDLAQYMAVNMDKANPLPYLPVFPAGQVIRARAEYAKTDSFEGVRYITIFRQDVSPFVANEFQYTFQGLSADKSYYVVAIFRITAPGFPAKIGSNFDYDAFSKNFENYLKESTDKLNKAAPNTFKPSLAALNATIESLSLSP